MAASLDIDGLDAGYGDVLAIHNVSMQVAERSIVAVLGANGAGKTTLLRTISGLLGARRGRVLLDGVEIQGRAPDRIVRQGLSHVPEGREVFPDLTVRENLLMGGYSRRDRAALPGDIDRVLQHFPALTERLSHPAGLLSGGQQQMVAIGRALMARPRVLLLDEPSLGLAPKIVKEIFAMLRKVSREDGLTTVLVEQNAQLALDISDVAYVMELGRVALSGPSAEIKNDARLQSHYLGAGGLEVRSVREPARIWS